MSWNLENSVRKCVSFSLGLTQFYLTSRRKLARKGGLFHRGLTQFYWLSKRKLARKGALF